MPGLDADPFSSGTGGGGWGDDLDMNLDTDVPRVSSSPPVGGSGSAGGININANNKKSFTFQPKAQPQTSGTTTANAFQVNKVQSTPAGGLMNNRASAGSNKAGGFNFPDAKKKASSGGGKVDAKEVAKEAEDDFWNEFG